MIQLPPDIIGKAISDAEFRKALFDDPQGALSAAGFEASPEIVAALNKLDRAAVEAFVSSLGDAVGDNAAG